MENGLAPGVTRVLGLLIVGRIGDGMVIIRNLLVASGIALSNVGSFLLASGVVIGRARVELVVIRARHVESIIHQSFFLGKVSRIPPSLRTDPSFQYSII